jgi:hypothetical protein
MKVPLFELKIVTIRSGGRKTTSDGTFHPYWDCVHNYLVVWETERRVIERAYLVPNEEEGTTLPLPTDSESIRRLRSDLLDRMDHGF